MPPAGGETTLTAVLKLRDEMSAGVKAPQRALENLQTSFTGVQKTANNAFARVGDGLKGVSAGFAQIDASANRFFQRTTNLTNRLLTIAVAAENLGGQDSPLKGVSVGLSTFATVAALVPGPIGLVGGAVAGLGAGLITYSRQQAEATEKMKEYRKQVEETRRALYEAAGQQIAAVETSKNPHLAEVNQDIERIRQQIGHQEALRMMAETEMSKNPNPLSVAFLKAKETAEDAKQSIADLLKILGDLENEAAKIRLDESIKAVGVAADQTHEKVMAGLITPLEAAQDRLRTIEGAINDLIKAKSALTSDEYESKLTDLLNKGMREKEIINAGKEDERRQREADRKREQAALRAMENSWAGLGMAAEEYVNQMKTVKDLTLDVARGLEGSLTNAISGILSGGQKLKSILKNLAADLKKTLIQTLSQTLSQQLVGGLMGGLGGLFAMGGSANAVPTVQNQPGGSSVNMQALGGAGGGLGAAFGIDQSTMGAIGGALAGGAIGAGGIQSGNVTQSALGMAMAGMSIGALAGPIGAVAGLAIGAIVGGIMGSRQKRRARRARRRAEEAARRAHDAAVAQARLVLKADIRNKMGGGSADESAAAEIGQLFSQDLSESEISQFGSPEAIAARAGEVNRQTTVNAPITVHAEISGTYDIEVLARELAYHLDNQMGGAAGGQLGA